MEGNIVKTAEEYRDGRQNELIRVHLQGPAKSAITQSIMIMQSNKTKEKSELRGGDSPDAVKVMVTMLQSATLYGVA
jgi:hypothetical protein